MTDYVECTVCGDEVGRMGIGKHAGMHKRQFREKFGRLPEDYDEVREKLEKQPPEDAPTLGDFAGGSDE